VKIRFSEPIIEPAGGNYSQISTEDLYLIITEATSSFNFGKRVEY